MDFKYIKLTDGRYGAWQGEGMKRTLTWYTGNSWSIGTTEDSVLNEDYYVIWNDWPVLLDAGVAGGEDNTSSYAGGGAAAKAAMDGIGLGADLFVRNLPDFAAGTAALDIAIVRKSDRRAVRIKVAAPSGKGEITTQLYSAVGVITTINPVLGPWSPEMGRLRIGGYV